ncbi:MAG: SDR family NAD(P)-dependent oxidoreductase, partial [Staphylococcus equorum]|nr:SDR family NAD(P)-dependent oxidoreductase [Staphylococcus equorum]
MVDWLNIEGKTVIVTGGSSGIGKSIVESLLAQKVNVANFDLEDSDLDDKHLLFVKTDVTSRSDVEAGVQTVIDNFGTIDGLVNNAGINIPRLLVDKNNPQGKYELSEDVFDKIIAVNQKGLFLMSQAVGRVLVEKEEGVIINMSSESGLEGSEGQSP